MIHLVQSFKESAYKMKIASKWCGRVLGGIWFLAVVVCSERALAQEAVPVEEAPPPPPPLEQTPPEAKKKPTVLLQPRDTKEAIDRVAINLTTIWITSADTITSDQIANDISGLDGRYIEALHRMLDQALPDPAGRPKVIKVRDALAETLRNLDPKRYPVGKFLNDPCYQSETERSCSERIGGFAAAASFSSNGVPCWKGLRNMQGFKGAQYKKGYLDWWHENVDAKDECVQPPRPARCATAVCWGGVDDYKFGVAFRPAVQLGATFGDGLGFSDEGSAAMQFSGALGVRAFGWNDTVDIHTGLGIGTALVDEDDSPQRNFLMVEGGVGVINGLLCFSYLHTFDPFRTGRGAGNGVSIYVDAAAIDRFSSQ